MTTALRANPDIIKEPPAYMRSPVTKSKELRVDRDGGYDGAGVIYGASVITRGEAEGHYMWIDREFNAAVAQHLNASKRGTKMRFTHPSLSGDGLGSFLGRAMDGRVSGDQVLTDLHFSKMAHKTPDGDLAEYVMGLAENDAEAFGLSIVFKHDRGAESKHRANHEDKDGNFESDDPDNKGNLYHARLQSLRAVDVVDSPAANPSGLFHRGHEFAAEADAVAMFALGLSDELPETNHLSIDAERFAAFADRFMEQHGLTLIREDKDMSKDNTQPTVEAAVKEATEKLSAEHKAAVEKLKADHAGTLDRWKQEHNAELAALKSGNKPPEKKDEQPSLDEARSSERTRVKELHALASNAGIKDQAVIDRWVDKGLSIADAKCEIADLAIKGGKLAGDDPGGDQKTGEAALRVEYRQYAKLHATLGVSEDQYVEGRKKELAKSA